MSQRNPSRLPTGIYRRHRRTCDGTGRCECPYLATVYSAREHKLLRKQFPTLAAAKRWRRDAQTAVEDGTMRAPTATTVRQAADVWLAGAEDGSIRTRSGDVYKPSALRGYRRSLTLHVLPVLGDARLSEVRLVDVQDLAERLLAQPMDPSTLRNALMPLRAIYRRAVGRGHVAVNPTHGVELPAVRGKRDRIAAPEEAAALLAALPEEDRALWATAMYAGLRRGELLGLDWRDLDLEKGVLRVERSWDVQVGIVDPKSAAGTRTVPVVRQLGALLREHRLRQGRPESGFVFPGKRPDRPFNTRSVDRRAQAAWTEAELTRITLHECRHTFASAMIAAGVNAKALASYMGHSSIQITYDRYGHLMPGNEAEAAGLLDAYLERSRVAES